MTEQTASNPPYDVVIIGGGPAGLTAGMYAARAALRTLSIAGSSTLSQITMTDLIENYPGIPDGIIGADLVDRFRKQAVQFGLQTASGDVTSVTKKKWGETDGWEVAAGEMRYGAHAVIIATGANWRRLGAVGEERFVGKGVSFCATCDGPFYRNREVAVVGGGSSAIQEAIYLTRFAKKVTVIHRRNRLRAAAVLQKRAFANEKIAFAWDSVVESIEGLDLVQGVRLKDVKTGATRELAVNGVFIFVGLTPNTAPFRGLVDTDAGGYITVDANMRTSAPGIFACGDCIAKGLRQVVTACGDGATAAISAQLYVEELKGEAY
ncbi:MAG: thioredoxin-disulfide reductase [Deltaproteobacteria bacterium]|nr:thioredoxin-disulfide reductase [Deltaproteobacteria bacterium]